MDEQELNKKLTKYLGYCWHDYKRSSEIDFNAPRMKHMGGYNGYNFRCLKCGGSTDSILDTYHPEHNYTESLDACFRRLVPKLQGRKDYCDINLRNFSHEMGKPYLFTIRIIIDDSIIRSYQGVAEIPALALCLAIGKLIDKEEMSDV